MDRAAARKLDRPEVPAFGYLLAFLRNDAAGMERAAALANGKPESEPWALLVQSLVLARSGKLGSAEERLRRAVKLCEDTNQKETAALYQSAGADWQGLFGKPAEASRIALDALKKSNGRDVQYSAAVAFALAGDSSRVQTIIAGLDKTYPEDFSVQNSYLPALRALLALKSGRAEQAIEFLKAAPYDYAVPGTAFVATFGGMYPVFVRGQAYVAAGKPAEAVKEFQKIVDHPGVVLADPVGALARLELGRAYHLAGDEAKARASYQDFFTIWRDADPDLPILKEAKNEFSKLH